MNRDAGDEEECRWLTTTEAARVLGYSAETMRKLLKSGVVRGHRPHKRGHFRVAKSEVERMLAVGR